MSYGLAGSGWFCYPGKLKQQSDRCAVAHHGAGSGWFCYPGKLKLAVVEIGAAGRGLGSGWFCYPGELKPDKQLAASGKIARSVPDGFAIRGS